MSRSQQFIALLGLISLAACATTTPTNIAGGGTQLETRQIQTRQYDTLDKTTTMRSVIAAFTSLLPSVTPQGSVKGELIRS